MANDIKRKLEIGLVTYIRSLVSNRSPLKSYTIVEGSQADDKQLPMIIVECMGSTEAFPTGPKMLKSAPRWMAQAQCLRSKRRPTRARSSDPSQAFIFTTSR